MEEAKEKKQEIRTQIESALSAMDEKEIARYNQSIENRLFEFANFLEARIALLYMASSNEVQTHSIIRRSFNYNKLVVLPAFDPSSFEATLMKVDDIDRDLVKGPRGISEPDPKRCKKVPIECIDIAIIPGFALDEKGGRIGSGRGYYDRLIPKLPITTRKVALAFEAQIVAQVPMESHDKHVDIIITEDRVIYKI